MVKYAMCLTTVGKRKDAEKIARHLVGKRLAACVNILPGLVSHYRWKGKACREEELLLVIKTTRAALKRLEREISEIHPYELPEFVVFSMDGGAKSYLRWIAENVL